MNEQTDILIAALAEIDRHVARAGWDQPARLFALVSTEVLIRQEPSLAAHLTSGSPDSLSSIEQEDFVIGDDVFETLGRMQWPATVQGCAIVMERTFLGPRHEADIPSDPAAAEAFVREHPDRQEARVVVGAMREDTVHGLARLRSHPEELLSSDDLVPALSRALLATLR
ncbi:PPA1309 family protein [Aestuariimicrobium soli]|uniref:PPA1309 family protein n=1 Tax=Aestuariimicrobium soli TaxID=2035834 RepID=UPI003EB6D8B4